MRMIKTDDLKKIAEILEKENCNEISEQQLIVRLKENEIHKEVASTLQGLICAVALEMEEGICSESCDNCKYYSLNNPPHSAFRLDNRVNHIIATVRELYD